MGDKVGYEIRMLSNLIKRDINNKLALIVGEQMTVMHAWVIKYVYDHQEEPIFQRNIEKEFSIRRSTATGILQVMEKNNLIVRVPVDEDARLKKIILTPKAIGLHTAIEDAIRELEETISKDLTKEEITIFFTICDKVKKNISEVE